MSIISGSSVTGAGGAAAAPYEIERSLRFNYSDSAYLNRTQGSGNRTTWTYSFWIKLGPYTSDAHVFTFNGLANAMYFNTDGQLLWYDDTAANFYLIPTQRFRDPSAWYHIVAVADTNNATQGDRIRLYVNGTRVTSFTTANYPTSGYTTGANESGTTATIGRSASSFGGYMTEVHFVDGQALDPTSFGEFNTDTGVWQPIEYTGTYGTNGFYLNFSDNASTTTLGDDFSGNGNDWTTNNFSVTAGAGNDSLVDSPTRYGTDTGAGGEVRGNYATWNALMKASQVTLTNGNLDAAHGIFGATTGVYGSVAVSSGKWYWEETITALSSGAPFIGIMQPAAVTQTFDTLFANTTSGYAYRSTGDKRTNSSDSAYGASYTTNDVIGVALDLDAGTLVFYKNGVSQGTAFSSLSGTFVAADGNGTSGGTYSSVINFGQRPFAYTAPSGFKALVTTNLPEPTIEDGGEYFNPVLYTGTGANLSVTGVGFQPSFVWIKSRSAGQSHSLYDAVRGATKQLNSNNTDAEGTYAGVSSFDADGFSVGTADNNTASATYVAWNWKANGAGVSNTAGTITSTVSVDTTSGFSIVTYTGNGSTGTVGHGLGVAPSMIIVKVRSTTNDWGVGHASVGWSQAGLLNLTNSFGASSYFNSTAPTSTVFSVGASAVTNTNSATYVAYCFAAVAGYSAFGSYTGNGSADGPFVYTGFRPRYIMQKRTDSTGTWELYDTARDTYNVMSADLAANLSDAETTVARFDSLSNGFKIRTTGAATNASGGTYIYMAFAENPFKLALAR